MPLTRAELVSLQSSCFAADLDITDEMFAWTAAQARRYFESGGTDTPEAAEATRKMFDAFTGTLPDQPFRARDVGWPEAVFEVIHAPRVVIREEPSTSSRVIGLAACGEQVVASAIVADGEWLQLLGDDAGYALIDGRSVGLGTLLRRVAPPWGPLTPARGPEHREPPSVRAGEFDYIGTSEEYKQTPLAPALLPGFLLAPPSALSAGLRAGVAPARAHMAARLVAQRGFAVLEAGLDTALISQVRLLCACAMPHHPAPLACRH